MASGTMRETILRELNRELSPSHIEVIDESPGHSRATPENPETHFRVVVVSASFNGLQKVRRQQMVYEVLNPLFKSGLHSLTQHTFTPEEWAKNPAIEKSPHCAGANLHK